MVAPIGFLASDILSPIGVCVNVALSLLAVLALVVPPAPGPIAASPQFSLVAGSTWTIEPVGHFGGSAPPRLAIDSTHVPHVFYCPPGDERFATRTSSGWLSEHVVSTAFGGGCGEFVMGADDVPRITTGVSPIGSRCEEYGVRANGTWAFECFPGGVLAAVDSLGRPHVVTYWTISATRYDLRHLWRNANATWEYETVEANALDASPEFLWYSLVLDVSDRPHILYYDSVRGDVRYAAPDSTGWHVEVVEHIGGLNIGGQEGALALGANGAPHIAYTVRTGPKTAEVRYGTREAGVWAIEVASEPASPLGGGAFSPSLGMTATGPLLTYVFVGPVDPVRIIFSQDLELSSRSSTSWVHETVLDGFWDNTVPRGQIPQFPTLRVDDCGNPHLAFYQSWWEGLDGSRSGAYYATKGELCRSSPLELKHEAITRIRGLKDQALGRKDKKFLHAVDETEQEVWQSLGFKAPFRPTAVAALPAQDVTARARDHDTIRLTLGSSWGPKLPSYTTIRLTWSSGVVTIVDLPKTWSDENGDLHAQPWVDAWHQDVRIQTERDAKAKTLTVDVRAEQASMGVTVSLDGDRVADLSFAYEMKHLWIDATHLDAKKGKEVFREEQDAVTELICRVGDQDHHNVGGSGADALWGGGDDDQNRCREEGSHHGAPLPAVVCRGVDPKKWTDTEIAALDSECDRIANLLVKADEILAQTALQDAQDMPIQNPKNAGHVLHEIEAGQRELKIASSEWDGREYGDAIGHFARAWEHAERAIVAANKK